jgi:hypothetical protein
MDNKLSGRGTSRVHRSGVSGQLFAIRDPLSLFRSPHYAFRDPLKRGRGEDDRMDRMFRMGKMGSRLNGFVSTSRGFLPPVVEV